MKYLSIVAVFLLFMGFNSMVTGQVIAFDDAWGDEGFNLVSQDVSGVEIVYSIRNMALNDITIEGENMKNIHISGIFLPNDAGAPNLPGSGRYIAIPEGGLASVQVLSSETEVFQDIDIAPAPPLPLETDDSPLVYEKNPEIYSRNAYYPESPVILSELSEMRGVDYVILGITPFQYNPAARELVVYKNIRVRVNFEGGNGHFGEDRLRSHYWEPVLQSNLYNYASLPDVDNNLPYMQNDRDEGFEYLIIIPDDLIFTAWADTIRNWRTLQGIMTGVVTLTEIGGNTAAHIENYVNNAYYNWDIPPVAVMLLSDYPSSGRTYGITSPLWNGYCVSDNIYADVNNDNLPDMAFARITAQDESDLSRMVGKFLDYERNPPTDPGVYDYPIVAGGWQLERWFILCTEICWGYLHNIHGKVPVREYAIYEIPYPGNQWSSNPNTYMLINYFGPNGLGYIPLTPSYLNDWGGNAFRVNNDINNGAFMLLHRDHGNEYGWGEPDYDIGDLSGLNNDTYPFVFSVNCLTGKYNYSSETFVEAFHRMEHGALGLIGASEISYSFVNDTYIFGLFDYLWPDFDPGYGEDGSATLNPCFANASGKYYLQVSNWPHNASDKTVTYHLFHHHGDAFITMYSEVPQDLDILHAPVLFAEFTEFTVNADPGALIALTVDGEIIGVAEGTGNPVAIPIEPQMPNNTMLITVTKPNYYRYSVEVDIIPPEGYGIVEGYVTDLVTDEGLQGIVTVTNRDPQIIAPCNEDGYFHVYVPADTLWDFRAEYTSDYLPSFAALSVSEDDTVAQDFPLEPKVEVVLRASFGNPEDIAYRTFYFKGSWNDDGFYDTTWTETFIPMSDDGVTPDETAGDGIFTGSVKLATDLANTYQWAIYSEDYTVEALLQLAGGFDILDPAEPPEVPVFEVNPSGSENNWTLTVEGDNELLIELQPGYENDEFRWSGEALLNAGTTYHFRIYPMHFDSASYGQGGVGGPDFAVTPNVTEEFVFIFNDNTDTIFLDSAHPCPLNLTASSDMDMRIELIWEEPRIDPESYKVYRADEISGQYVEIGIVPCTELGFSDETVSNYQDYYYYTTAIYTGDVESLPSNIGEGYAVTGARLSVSPGSFEVYVNPGDSLNTSLFISNDGDLELNYEIAASEASRFWTPPVSQVDQQAFRFSNTANDKTYVKAGPKNPPQLLDSGGPDIFGYAWIDSDDPGGPEFDWIDITSFGTPIDFGGDIDDGNGGPLALGFTFRFYGNEFSSINVCTNGWASFSNSTSVEWGNQYIPNPEEPNDMLAVFYDDMNLEHGGDGYFYTNNADTAIITWDHVPDWRQEGIFTFQIILIAPEKIVYQYLDLGPGRMDEQSIGIENEDGSIGLPVAVDQSYVHDSLAIRFFKDWLRTFPSTGVVAPQATDTVNVLFDAATLVIGDYSGLINISGGDIYHSEEPVSIPAAMHVADQSGVDDDIVNNLPAIFALNQNYPNPFNPVTTIKYSLPDASDVSLDIYDILGRKVITLVDEYQPAGYHQAVWNADQYATGMYFYKIKAGDFTKTKKMLLLK